jgi:IS5 family transposase
MYRKQNAEQMKLEIPYGVILDAENRWIKLSSIMPWEKIDETYSANFTGTNGQVAKSSRLAFGALYIQRKLSLTDEETVDQIRENPSMQYFCGFETYTIQKPFDSSLMVHFRKRLTEEAMKKISEAAFAAEAKKAILEKAKEDTNDKNDKNDTDDDGNDPQDNPGTPKGTLYLDATCFPSDIHYPTDIGLLNHARELTEEIIDILHDSPVEKGMSMAMGAAIARGGTTNHPKPRTYREVARKAYMEYIKKRKHTKEEIRFVIRRQLQYVRRNIGSIEKQASQGKALAALGNELEKKLGTIKEVYRQQKHMHDNDTHTVEDRIVSIAQPHIRPIVRGKSGAPVEFGAKAATANIGGFTFMIQTGYDNFSEAKYLEKTAEEYKRMFGFYPKVIVGDKAYPTRENRKYCKSKGIRLSCRKMGRTTEEEKEAERKQLYEDNCGRNAVEGDYGTVKRKYGLSLIMTKLYETTLTAISFGFFVKNMERILRLFVFRFFIPNGNIWNFNLRAV